MEEYDNNICYKKEPVLCPVKDRNQCTRKWMDCCKYRIPGWSIGELIPLWNELIPLNVDNSDNETTHISAENPILEILISEDIRYYIWRFYTITAKPFLTKSRITMNLTDKVEEETIFSKEKFFKEFVNPKTLFCIHFKETTVDLLTLITTLQKTFKNNA